MRLAETIAGIVLVAVVLYYLFQGNNSAGVINSVGTQSSAFVRALMGRS